MSEISTEEDRDNHETLTEVGNPDPLIDESGGLDETLVSSLNQLAEIVAPVLEKLFQAAETDTDLWLKKKEVKILTDWQLITARQLDAMQQMLASQPTRKLWQPGI